MAKEVILIGAVSMNGVYGEGGAIPWHVAADMEHFKNLTTGHTVVMGRGTWESLPEKFRPLPRRENIVVSNTPSFVPVGATKAKSLKDAILDAKHDQVFVIGGADLWLDALSNHAGRLEITVIQKEIPVSGKTRTALPLLTPESRGFELMKTWDETCKDQIGGDQLLVSFKTYSKAM